MSCRAGGLPRLQVLLKRVALHSVSVCCPIMVIRGTPEPQRDQNASLCQGPPWTHAPARCFLCASNLRDVVLRQGLSAFFPADICVKLKSLKEERKPSLVKTRRRGKVGTKGKIGHDSIYRKQADGQLHRDRKWVHGVWGLGAWAGE